MCLDCCARAAAASQQADCSLGSLKTATSGKAAGGQHSKSEGQSYAPAARVRSSDTNPFSCKSSSFDIVLRSFSEATFSSLQMVGVVGWCRAQGRPEPGTTFLNRFVPMLPTLACQSASYFNITYIASTGGHR